LELLLQLLDGSHVSRSLHLLHLRLRLHLQLLCLRLGLLLLLQQGGDHLLHLLRLRLARVLEHLHLRLAEYLLVLFTCHQSKTLLMVGSRSCGSRWNFHS